MPTEFGGNDLQVPCRGYDSVNECFYVPQSSLRQFFEALEDYIEENVPEDSNGLEWERDFSRLDDTALPAYENMAISAESVPTNHFDEFMMSYEPLFPLLEHIFVVFEPKGPGLHARESHTFNGRLRHMRLTTLDVEYEEKQHASPYCLANGPHCMDRVREEIRFWGPEFYHPEGIPRTFASPVKLELVAPYQRLQDDEGKGADK